MPKKMLRSFLPHPAQLVSRRGLKWLAPFVEDSNLFHLNRQSVSMAFAVGIFCAFLPLPGQMIIAALIALVLRCNLPLAVILIWISNPLTMGPMFYLTYSFGRWLLGSPPMDFSLQLSWEWFRAQGSHLIGPLVLGSLITGLVCGAAGYFIILGLWRWQVMKSWGLRQSRRQLKPPSKADYS